MTSLEQSNGVELADYAPVILDPEPQLPAALVRWRDLVEDADGRAFVKHDSDAEKVMPMPRPAWADPDNDRIADALTNTTYCSEQVRVAATWSRGKNHADTGCVERAAVGVQAKLVGDATICIAITVRRVVDSDETWRALGANLTPAEAVELSEVLLAAVDLIGGEK